MFVGEKHGAENFVTTTFTSAQKPVQTDRPVAVPEIEPRLEQSELVSLNLPETPRTESEALGRRYLLTMGRVVSTEDGEVIRAKLGTTEANFWYNRETNRWQWEDEDTQSWSNTDENPFPASLEAVNNRRMNEVGALLARLHGDQLPAARTQILSAVALPEFLNDYLGTHAQKVARAGGDVFMVQANSEHQLLFRWNQEHNNLEWCISQPNGRAARTETPWLAVGQLPAAEVLDMTSPSIRPLRPFLDRMDRLTRDFSDADERRELTRGLSSFQAVIARVSAVGTEQAGTAVRRTWTFAGTDFQLSYDRSRRQWEFRNRNDADWTDLTNTSQLPKNLRDAGLLR